MIQKILVILVGLVMSLVGALAPSAQFASRDAHLSSPVAEVADASDTTLASVRTSDSSAFARIPVLWVEVDGKRVTEDAWGTGEVHELKFKVGVKDVEGVALAVGDKLVPLRPTDVMTVRTFRGDFAYRDITTAVAGLQLQGSVKTTSLHAGAPTGKLTTSLGETASAGRAQSGGASRIAYVTLSTGEDVDTVSVQTGGARIVTEEDTPAGAPDLGNLLVKWVKVDGRPVREYTWGTGTVDRLEFEPASGEGGSVALKFREAAADAAPGAHVLVKDFVGEYLIYQVSDQLLRIRLDGHAGDLTTGVGLEGSSLAPHAGEAPIPQFESTPQVLHTTDALTLKDRSTDDGIIVFWKWDFADGVTSVLQDATHRFSKPGIYNVSLTVTDDDLNTATVTRAVVVNNADPVPDFEFNPRIVTTDTLVGFTDRSLDADGLVASWSWDFGDGTTSTMRHPSHRFETSGETTVTLSVLDDLGGKAALSKRILIHNTPPLASFVVSNKTPLTLDPVQFSSQSIDKDGRIVDWSWNFGDDPRDLLGAQAHGPDVFHTYKRAGAFPVRLTVADNAGDLGTTQLTLVVANQPPTADFAWAPGAIHTREEVTFVSTSNDSDGFILTNEWDFGDGTNTSVTHAVTTSQLDQVPDDAHNDTGTPDASRNPPYAPPPPVTHRFSRPLDYNVKLCTRDNSLAQTCQNRTVHVLNSPPSPSIHVGRQFTTTNILRNENLTLTDTSLDPESDPIVFRAWQFGDGTPDASGGDEVAAVLHRYPAVGTYVVNLTVRDVNGAEARVPQAINVGYAAPTAEANVDARHPGVGQPVHFFGNATDPDSNGPFTFHWNFGDGSNESNAKDPIHPFSTAAPTTVTLIVTDADGQASPPQNLRIDVDYAFPVPDFSWLPPTVTEGQTVAFTDLSTTTNGYVTGRSWSWGDGTPNAVGNDSAPTHTFANCVKGPGPAPWGFDTKLKVSDTRYTLAEPDLPQAAHRILVNCKPTAAFNIQSQMPTGLDQPVSFKDDSIDPEGGVLARHWDWGDSTTSDSLNGDEIAHAFGTPGQHTVTLTTTDDHGATATAQRFVQVFDRAPHADFDWAPRPAVANAPVQFTSTGFATDPDGNETLAEWRWDFGDGSPLLIGAGPAVADPVHTFPHSGTYLVRLVVSDGSMASGANDPGSIHFVRVGADHALDVGLRGILPYGADQDLSSPVIDVKLVLAAGPTVYDKSMFHYDLQGGHFTIPAGIWAEGDTITTNLRDARISINGQPFSPTAHVTLTDASGVASPVGMSYHIPLPLRNAIDIAPGSAPPTIPIVDADRTPGEDPIYHTTTEDFHGVGHVEYLDGHDANAAVVDVYIRLVTGATTDTTTVQNGIPDNVLLGWCKVATVNADLQGDYGWSARRDTGCPLLNLPLAHYEIRALARHMAATPAFSPDRDVYVDPTGLFAAAALP